MKNFHTQQFKIKLHKFNLNYKKSSFSHFQSSGPGLLPCEEEEEEDPS